MSSTIHSEFRRSPGGQVLTLQAVDRGARGKKVLEKPMGK